MKSKVKKILVPFDESENSKKSLRYAYWLASARSFGQAYRCVKYQVFTVSSFAVGLVFNFWLVYAL